MENGHYVTKNRFAIPDQSEVHVLIINLKHFDDPKINIRYGTEVDEIAVKSFFENHTNCKEVQIVRRATEDKLLNPVNGIIAQFIRKCLTNCHLCVFGIMTHGLEDGSLVMSDGKKISKTNIFDCFSSFKCEALKKIPKLFIMTACRGYAEAHYQRGLSNHLSGVSAVETPSASTGVQLSHDSTSTVALDASPILNHSQNPVFRLETEMMEYGIVYSTCQGYPSVRTVDKGTIFIRTFCEVITKFYQMEDFGSMMTRVNRHMQSVAPEVNISIDETSEKIVEFGIPCKWDPHFSNTLYFVSNPKPLSKQTEEELETDLENFMEKNFGPLKPVNIQEGEIEADHFSDKKTLSCIEEIIRKMKTITLNNADELPDVPMDGCVIVRLLFTREIFSTGGEYPNKFSFLFRDEKSELPIYSYGTAGAKLSHKLTEGKLYLIRDAILRKAEQASSPLGRGEIQVVMKPECICEVQLNEAQMLLHNIPTYMSYQFSSISDVINDTTQDDAFYDIIGRLKYRMEKKEIFKENTGDTIHLIGPSKELIEVVVWNEYREAIPEYGDVVAIRHGKLWKGELPKKLSVNTNSFIQKIDNPEKVPPSQRKFFTALPELPPRLKRPRLSV